MFDYDLYLQNEYERYCGEEYPEEEPEIEEEESEDEDAEIERAENLIEKRNMRKLYGR